MPDREKVIKGLECCIKHDPDDKPRCGECPYDGACLNRLKADALELAKDYGHVLSMAKKMHTWIFLNTADEFKVYDELGFTDEDNALLGSIGRPMVIAAGRVEDDD